MHVKPSEEEVREILIWSQEKVYSYETDFEEGTYEGGVRDALCWLLGLTDSRPDE